MKKKELKRHLRFLEQRRTDLERRLSELGVDRQNHAETIATIQREMTALQDNKAAALAQRDEQHKASVAHLRSTIALLENQIVALERPVLSSVAKHGGTTCDQTEDLLESHRKKARALEAQAVASADETRRLQSVIERLRLDGAAGRGCASYQEQRDEARAKAMKMSATLEKVNQWLAASTSGGAVSAAGAASLSAIIAGLYLAPTD